MPGMPLPDSPEHLLKPMILPSSLAQHQPRAKTVAPMTDCWRQHRWQAVDRDNPRASTILRPYSSAVDRVLSSQVSLVRNFQQLNPSPATTSDLKSCTRSKSFSSLLDEAFRVPQHVICYFCAVTAYKGKGKGPARMKTDSVILELPRS